MQPLIFTLVGKDKPGLIDSLAKQVRKLDGNWLASNFSHMAGHLAGFVQVDLALENHQTLIDTLSKHPDLTIHPISSESLNRQQLELADIEIMGNDKAGIVSELTTVLHQFNINIVKFETSCESAPNWGSLLFKANAKIEIPAGFDTESLRDALEDIANDLIVDIELR